MLRAVLLYVLLHEDNYKVAGRLKGDMIQAVVQLRAVAEQRLVPYAVLADQIPAAIHSTCLSSDEIVQAQDFVPR